ncbi:PfkB family carbohydrate kinase [Georgenia faecalis]|uniref:Ribokinase n=1 Tax=Georgenia faecalis TaxID=2483799 RepID=A0ABV9D599_9MICO|nr:PfkB family carbohydrate kinase [Georgenia faecalis]
MSSAAAGAVVVVGSANLDLVVDVPRHPGAGETILGGDLRRSPGGKGANQAVAAARAGGASTTFLGSLGNDDGAEILLASLERAGVRTDLVQRSAAATGTALISVTADGENTIIVAPGANGDLRIDAAARARLAEADVVLAQLEIPLETVLAAAAARRPGAVLALNAAPSRDLPAPVWDALDLLVVNEHEALDLTGAPDQDAALAALLARVPAVVITLGSAGCLVAERGRPSVEVPSPRVPAVDTTGAGDTFCGVLAAALAAGEPLVAAARRAAAAGALAVTRPGAQEAVPTAAETAELVRAGYPDVAAGPS